MVKEVDELEEIKKCIENNRNFLLSGGAGSGKTYSLVQTINLMQEEKYYWIFWRFDAINI